MTILTERVRYALAPDLDVIDEIASGGMGVVYRARDAALDRVVAVKIMRPELATAGAAERFLREARALAAFSHPNIVPIHTAGERDGLAWYVMDFMAGETLAGRLARGPMPPDEALRLAGDLLSALEAVHAHGIVHRDVKPMNIFLVDGRAVLGDFGLARTTAPPTSAVTAPGHVIGTPGYMPPEQLAGREVTPRTDISAAGMVIYEAFTRRQWVIDSGIDSADWSSVPPAAVPVLRRALAWSPADRWASAGAMRIALGGGSRRRTTRRWIMAAAALAALGVLAMITWTPSPASTPGLLGVRVQRLVPEGGTSTAFADSLSGELLRALRASPDIEFSLAPARPGYMVVEGTVGAAGDRAHATLTATSADGKRLMVDVPVAAPRASIADSLASRLLRGIWESRDPSFHDLPIGALPASPGGFARWAAAENLYATVRWTAAYQSYSDALGADSTCALCAFRLLTITRWLRASPDPALSRVLDRAIGRFTPAYQALIRAGTDTAGRLDALASLVRQSPAFDMGHFFYGDELFHRGMLEGRSRALAQAEFRTVTQLRPHFAPGWEHLAWIAIAEGDSASANEGLAKYAAEASNRESETQLKLALLHVGYAWRFGPRDRAIDLTRRVLGDPLIQEFQDLRFSANYLTVFDAPASLVWLGDYFARWPARSDLHAHGLVAQIVGYRALGREDSAAGPIGLLRRESSDDPEYALGAAGFDAVQVLFDPRDSAEATRAWPALRAALGPMADMESATPDQRRRAAWWLTLLARRARADDRPWRARVRGEAAPAPFATLLDADTIARTRPHAALDRSHALLALDSAGRAGDPFFRSVLHLLRAEWHARDGQPASALLSLQWYGNYDIVGQPGLTIQAEDADWSLGTLARWRRTSLAPDGKGLELCRDLQDVARLWHDGTPRYRARADTAEARRAALGCAAP